MLPLFRFPTKLLVVDDEPGVLSAVESMLKGRNFVVECSQSGAALPKIDKKIYTDLRNIFIKISPDHYTQDANFIRISNNEIHKLIYYSKRFELLSVMIVDYHLPIMNGLELIDLLNNELPIKKILITGDDYSQLMAIDAFNRRLIDGFVNKRNITQLPELVKSLANSFFDNFATDFADVAGYRSDPKLMEFLQDAIQARDPSEYYPLNERGSHLMIDGGKVSAIFVERENNIAKFLDFMRAENLDPNIYNKIHSREYMPIMHHYLKLDDSIQIAPCGKIEGSNNLYYYTFIDDPALLDINTKKIATFENFVKRR